MILYYTYHDKNCGSGSFGSCTGSPLEHRDHCRFQRHGGALDATLPESIFSAVIEAWGNLFYDCPEAPRSLYNYLSAGVTVKKFVNRFRTKQRMDKNVID